MKQQHFLIISLPAQGHINPTLQLAKNLSRAGARCTFATTVNGFRKMNNRPSIDGLFYASFSDGYDDGMPKMDFGDYLKEFKRVGSENLRNLVDKFSNDGHPVTFLVYTILFPWVAEVAREIDVPSAFLAIQCATAFAIYHHLFTINDNGVYSSTSEIEPSFPIKLPELPLFSRDDIPTFLLLSEPHSSFMIPVMREHIQTLEHDPNPLVLINSFDKLEEKSMKILEKIRVCSIGPLIPSAFSDGNDIEDKSFGCDLFDKSETYCQWLDSKPEGSVVYVSFGSLAMLKEEQKEEVLQGLLESERPFLWVIRSSKEDDKNNNDENAGLHGKGMIVPWCSQLEVLFHKSIGCFFSHCGWNSTLESMAAGVPLIGYPQFSDQMTNIKMVEEVWGTGVRARVEEEGEGEGGGGIVKREELKRCLEILMGDGEKGNEIRRNVKKYRDLAMEAVKVEGSSYNNLNKFLESLCESGRNRTLTNKQLTAFKEYNRSVGERKAFSPSSPQLLLRRRIQWTSPPTFCVGPEAQHNIHTCFESAHPLPKNRFGEVEDKFELFPKIPIHKSKTKLPLFRIFRNRFHQIAYLLSSDLGLQRNRVGFFSNSVFQHLTILVKHP